MLIKLFCECCIIEIVFEHLLNICFEFLGTSSLLDLMNSIHDGILCRSLNMFDFFFKLLLTLFFSLVSIFSLVSSFTFFLSQRSFYFSTKCCDLICIWFFIAEVVFSFISICFIILLQISLLKIII